MLWCVASCVTGWVLPTPSGGGGDKDDDDDDDDEPVEGETTHACYVLHNTCVCIKCFSNFTRR